jgi:diaminopimelate decarboxylase
MVADVVGPLCTPLDTIGRSVKLPHLDADDLIGVFQSGAYGLSASPGGFLSRPTPAEVLVDAGVASIVRPAGRPEDYARNAGLTRGTDGRA